MIINPPESVAEVAQATPTITVSTGGLITAKATQSAGYVASGTKSATKQLTTQAAKTVTPSTSEQTAVSSGVYTTGAIKVAAMPTAGTITGDLGTTGGAVWNTSGDTNRGSGTVSIKNVKQTAGYTAGYSGGTLTINVPANRLLRGRTVTPTTSEQTIANAEDIAYGAIKVAGDANLKAANIKSGVSIFGVAGSASTTSSVSVTLKNNTSVRKSLNFYSLERGICLSYDAAANGGATTQSVCCGIIVVEDSPSISSNSKEFNVSLSGGVSFLFYDQSNSSFQANNGKHMCILRVGGDGTITVS